MLSHTNIAKELVNNLDHIITANGYKNYLNEIKPETY